MTDHIGEATKKVIDLDAMEKLRLETILGGLADEAASAALGPRHKRLARTVHAKNHAINHIEDVCRAFLARNGKGEG